jgi:hypothetical protein
MLVVMSLLPCHHACSRHRWTEDAKSKKGRYIPYASLLEQLKHVDDVAVCEPTPIEPGLVKATVYRGAIYEEERETKRPRHSSLE